MYTLINEKVASMYELKNVYTLGEALKLYAVHEMTIDVQNGQLKEVERG